MFRATSKSLGKQNTLPQTSHLAYGTQKTLLVIYSSRIYLECDALRAFVLQ